MEAMGVEPLAVRELQECSWYRGEKRSATGIVNGLDGNGTQAASVAHAPRYGCRR